MTDLQKVIELYRGFGIECLVFVDKDNNQCIKLDSGGGNNRNNPTFSDKISGYTGFYTVLEFDSNGLFIRQGIWE